MKRFHVLLLLLALVLLALPFRAQVRAAARTTRDRGAVEKRVRQYGPAARERLRPFFHKAGVSYPPARLVLVGLKSETSLQVYAANRTGPLRFLRAYPILAASGNIGPKLREGDCQVPEGLYRISGLNPYSAYHLALRVNYPNDFDRRMAHRDQRTPLGGDIMIHGNACSIGCLAMGDPAAEDLFVLAAETGLARIAVIISPYDFRLPAHAVPLPAEPAWVNVLYRDIRAALSALPAP